MQNEAITAGLYADFDNISVREIDPLAVSIQMQGRMTYADTDTGITVHFFEWQRNSGNEIYWTISDFSTRTGKPFFLQWNAGVSDDVSGSDTAYSPGVNVPFNLAARHGSTFINGAVDGTALTANTTPTALTDLSATNLQLAFDYMGCIRILRMWNVDLGDAGLEEATT